MRSVAGRVAVSLVVGVCVLGLASTEPHDRRVARWFGAGAQPALIFAVSVPAGLDRATMDALEPAWRERLGGYGVRFRLPSGPHALDIEVIGARAKDADAIIGALTVPGTLEFLPVVSDTEAARAMYQRVHGGGYPTVEADVDSWLHESGRVFEDFYLRAPSIAVLEAAIAEMQRVDSRTVLSPDHRIAFEKVTPWPDAEDPRPFVRTYVVETEPVIDGANVAHAYVIFDPQTNRPEVLLELDELGTRRFGEYTAEVAGEKMAIVLDGEIRSAPVIQTAIRGGRCNISMGGSDPREQQAEAEALAAVLEHPGSSLPPGITARLMTIDEPSFAVRWAVRLGVAAGAALLAFGLATLIARRTTLAPVITRPTTPRTAAAAAPLAITVGLLALVVLLERVPLPWLADWLFEMDGGRAQFSIVSLGISPVLSAYLLIETLALIIPSWRARRLGTPVDRVPVDRAVAVAAVVFALMQGYFIAQYLQSLVLDRPALVDRKLVGITVMLTLAGGVMLMAVVASLITRAGLINGWLALVGLDGGRRFLDVVTAPAPPVGLDPAPVQMFTAALAAGVAIALVVRRAEAPDRRRLPIGGLAPLLVAPSLVGFLAIPYLATLGGIEDVSKWLATRSPWLDLAAATILAVIWVAPRRGRVASSFALSLSVAAIALLGALPFFLPRDYQLWNYVVSGAVVAAAAVELAAGIARKLRMPDGAALIAVHDVDRADAIKDALDAAEIPAAHGGILARALLRFFGPYLPVVVYVPQGRLDEATTIVQKLR